MMRMHREEIEQVLERPLSDADLTHAADTSAITALQEDNVRRLARWSRPLAVAYLRAVVPSCRMQEFLQLLERLGVG